MYQPHWLSYDKGAYVGWDISSACHPPALDEGFMTSKQTFVAENDNFCRCSKCCQMVFDQFQWKAFVNEQPKRGCEQGAKSRCNGYNIRPYVTW